MLHGVKGCAIIEGMKNTTTTKENHVGLRLDDDSLKILDGLCEDVGGASRSRVLRRLLGYLRTDPSDKYKDEAGNPIETNHRRREFVEWFRKLDDAIIADMVAGIDAGLRRR